MRNPFGQLAAWCSKRPAIVLPVVLLVAVGLGAGMGQANEGRIYELFVPDTLPALDTLHEIQDIWGESEPAFFLYLTDDPTDPTLIRAVDADMKRLAGVESVLETRGFPDILERMIGGLDDASDAEIRSAAAQAIAQGMATGFATDDAILTLLDLEPGLDVIQATDDLRDTAATSTADADVRAAGLLFIERLQNEDAGADVGILMPLSLVVVIFVLAFLFRRLQDVVIPLVTTLVAIAMAYGTIAWTGMPIAPPSFIVMPLLLGLGVDYLLHVIYVYREQEPALDISERFRRTGAHVGWPVFFTALTTLIGFGSFLLSSLPQIRIWGVLIGAGALYAFLLSFTFMPALYRLTRRKQKPSRQPLAGLMEPVARFIPRHPRAVIGTVLGITLAFALIATQINITPDLEFAPDEDAQVVKDFNAIQDRFGGQTFAMFLIPADGDRAALEAFEDDVADATGVSFIDGPIHRLERAGEPNGALVGPITDGVATDDWWLVIAGYEFEDGEEILKGLEAIEKAAPFDARLTGQDRIQRESDSQFLPNIGGSTGVALSLVILILLVIFRHVGLGALTFLPLVLTMAWQLGIQTLTGIPLNPITAVMTAMMIGVGVDYSIHVMSHFLESRRAGRTPPQAAHDAIASVGKPVLAATITTVFAFSVLGFSSLLPLRDFGRVAAIVVACAFVISLTFLPAVLSLLPDRTRVASPVASLRRPASPNDRFTVKPRFSDPKVQKWFEEEWRGE